MKSLSLVPGTDILESLEFSVLEISSVIHKEAFLITFELTLMRWLRVGSLGHLRMGLDTWQSKWREGWNFQPHPPTSRRQGGGSGLSSSKNFGVRFYELLDWPTHPCAKRGVHPSSAETEAPGLGTFPDLHLWISSPGFSFVLFMINH